MKIKDKGHLGYKTSTVTEEFEYIPDKNVHPLLWHPILGTTEQVPTSLKEWRVMRGYTLREVETLTGVSNAYLSQLETGKVSNPSFDTVVKLCNCYQVKISI